jgi:hypothetical protein
MYGLEINESWFDSMEEEETLLYTKLAEPVLGSTQSIHWAQGTLSLE